MTKSARLGATLLILTTLLLPSVPAGAAVPLRVDRIGGANRFATAAGVARAWIGDECGFRAENGVLEEGQSEEECRRELPISLLLSRADAFADALSAASTTDSPVLLTPPDRLPPEVIELGSRFGVYSAGIFGSESVISTQVEDEIRERGYAQEVTRYAGPDRYATSAVTAGLNARRYSDSYGYDYVPQIVIATGDTWPDGLAASALARLGTPILLTRRDQIPQVARDVIIQYGSSANTTFVLVGGEAAISQSVVDQLGEVSDGAVVRLAGADRSATARAIADRYFSNPPGPFEEASDNGIILIRPDSFADAIAAPALIHSRKAPIIIPATPTGLGQSNIDWLTENGARIDSVTTLGDTGVVPDRIVQQALDAICSTRNCSPDEPESVDVTAGLELLTADGDPVDPDSLPYTAEVTDPGTIVEDRRAFHEVLFTSSDGDIDLDISDGTFSGVVTTDDGQLVVSGPGCGPSHDGTTTQVRCADGSNVVTVYEGATSAADLTIDTDDYLVGTTPILPGTYTTETPVAWSPAGEDNYGEAVIFRITYTVVGG